MGRYEKTRQKLLSGVSDTDINFSELCQLLRHLEFSERIRGGHHIFTKDSVAEIINLQPKGKKAKIYQVKQVRNLIIKYRLGEHDVN